jgi:hypothetical protein
MPIAAIYDVIPSARINFIVASIGNNGVISIT